VRRVHRRKAMANLRQALLLLLFLSSAFGLRPALAQNPMLPDTPSHRFFDQQNKAAFMVLGGLVAVDAARTQAMLGTHHYAEANPLARPLVNQGWPGQVAVSTIGYGAALGVSYIFHRTGHHKMEHCATWFMVAAETANDARNLLLR
jgi:hypothetical protein